MTLVSGEHGKRTHSHHTVRFQFNLLVEGPKAESRDAEGLFEFICR